ncbi:MAG: glycoside hydrolase domain-containing protein [Jatrophihabitantaceae bacterium]
MSTADALDQSWARVDPAGAAAAGITLIAGYLSRDPSKNWTADNIRAYHQHGIGVLLNWESDPAGALLGESAGEADGNDAVALTNQLMAEVGYRPQSPIAIVFSCDLDVVPTQFPAIDAYYLQTKTITHTAGLLNGCYGSASLVSHLHDAGLTEVEWQTLAWSDGYISPDAGLYQESINNTLDGSSVDLDEIRNLVTIGAWWPPGSADEAAANANSHPSTDEDDDDMPYIVYKASAPANAYVVHSGGHGQPLLDASTTRGYRGGGVKAFPIADKDWDNTLRAIGVK